MYLATVNHSWLRPRVSVAISSVARVLFKRQTTRASMLRNLYRLLLFNVCYAIECHTSEQLQLTVIYNCIWGSFPTVKSRVRERERKAT